MEPKYFMKEDISNMLELQCLVIEDLLRSRNGLGSTSPRKEEKPLPVQNDEVKDFTAESFKIQLVSPPPSNYSPKK